MPGRRVPGNLGPALQRDDFRFVLQPAKKTISLEQWEARLGQVKVPKEDMNRLVMNFLVTEVGPISLSFACRLVVHYILPLLTIIAIVSLGLKRAGLVSIVFWVC